MHGLIPNITGPLQKFYEENLDCYQLKILLEAI